MTDQTISWEKHGTGDDTVYAAVRDGAVIAEVYRGGVADYPWSTSLKTEPRPGKAHPSSTLGNAKAQVEMLYAAKAPAPSDEPHVIVMDCAQDPFATGNGWRIDIQNYEALGLTDTSSRWFAREEDARAFAAELGALLRLPVVDLDWNA